MSTVQLITKLAERLEKAKALVEDGCVHPITGEPNNYVVESERDVGTYYHVNGVCTCPDFQHRGKEIAGWCKHKLAVELMKEQEQAGKST